MAGRFLSLLLWIYYTVNIVLANNLPAGCSVNNETLICEGKQITQLPITIPDSVTHLVIRDASITTLDIEPGSNLRQLTTLTVQNSDLTKISEQFFEKLSGVNDIAPRLEKMFLHGNQISELNNGEFKSASYLKELSLSNNSLTSISGVFDGLTSLQRLYLQGNKIPEILNTDFNGLDNIAYIDLKNNRISNIEEKSFSKNHRLVHLIIDGNKLSNESNIHLVHTSFKTISIKQCMLTQVPRELPETLHQLDLSHNNIKQLNADDFKKYSKNLQELILSDNDIDHIQHGMLLEFESLHTLGLSGNKLHKVPGPFPDYLLMFLERNMIDTMNTDHFHVSAKTIVAMQLDHNNIRKLSDNLFKDNITIFSLSLSANPITVLEDGIFSNANLHLLNLNSLNLDEIQADCFLGLDSLITLRMRSVNVPEDKIGENVFKHVNPVNLHLEGSPILANTFLQSITKYSRSYTLLKRLHLSHNNITSWPEDIHHGLPNIAEISIAGNYFNCTKTLSWLYEWYKSNPSAFVDINEARCHWPTLLRGLTLHSVFIHGLHSIDNDNHTDTDVYYDPNVYQDYDYNFTSYDTMFNSFYDHLNNWTPDDNNSETVTHDIMIPTTVLTDVTTDDDDVSDMATVTMTTDNIQHYITTTEDAGDTVSMTTPGTTRRMTTTPSRDNDDGRINPYPHDDGPSSIKSVGIAIGMSFGVILFMLAIAFLVYKLCVKPPTSVHQNGHQTSGQDYVFVAPRNDKPEPVVHRKLSRAERGSTTSHASEDITNHVDMDMKVYTLDMDEE